MESRQGTPVGRFPEELPQPRVSRGSSAPARPHRHARRLRGACAATAHHTPDRLSGDAFRPGTRLTLPDGGMLLWLQLPEARAADALFSAPRWSGVASRSRRVLMFLQRTPLPTAAIRLGCGRAPDAR